MSEERTPQAKSWDDGTHKVQYYPWFTPAHPHFYVLSDSKSGQLLSNMTLDRGGEIMGLETHPKYRNQGHASRLWDTANRNSENAGVKPKHSDLMTEAGEGWAKKVGGELPPQIARSRETQMRGMLKFD